MIRRSTWVLLAVFVVLLGVTFYLQRNPIKKADTTPTEALTLLFEIPAERSVQGIQIRDVEGHTVEIVDNGAGDWRLQGTVEVPADSSRVEQAIIQLRNTQVLLTVQSQIDTQSIGLNPPVYQVEITLDDGTHQSVSIGDLNPTGSGYYTLQAGKPLQVASKSSVDSFTSLLTNPPYQPTATPPPTTLPGPALPPEGTPTSAP